MFNTVLYLGLVAIPFLPVLGYQGREPRFLLAMMIATTLGILHIDKLQDSKRYKWFAIFLIYCLFSSWQAPKPSDAALGIAINNFYIWREIMSYIAFIGAFIAISESDLNIKLIERTMIVVGTIMSIHAIFQSLGIMQWFTMVGRWDNMEHVTSFLGNCTVLSPFIGMIIPIALHRKNYLLALLMIVTVILAHGQIGIIAMILSLLFYACTIKKVRAVAITISVIFIIALSIGVATKDTTKVINDTGRFVEWRRILDDTTSKFYDGKCYFYTGLGAGSFKYIYHTKHKQNWCEAHNDYLETLYELGLFGVIILSISFFSILRLIPITSKNNYLYSSFLCISLCAGGMFVFQLGTHIFYSIVVLGILNNKEFRGELQCHSSESII